MNFELRIIIILYYNLFWIGKIFISTWLSNFKYFIIYYYYCYQYTLQKSTKIYQNSKKYVESNGKRTKDDREREEKMHEMKWYLTVINIFGLIMFYLFKIIKWIYQHICGPYKLNMNILDFTDLRNTYHNNKIFVLYGNGIQVPVHDTNDVKINII